MSVSVVASPRNHRKALENIEVFEGFFFAPALRIPGVGNRMGITGDGNSDGGRR